MALHRITRHYLRLRSGIALAILLMAAIAAFGVTLSGQHSVAKREDNSHIIDQILVSLSELALAFDEVKTDPNSQKAVVARGRIRRSAVPASSALEEIQMPKRLDSYSVDAQEILLQQSLNPLEELTDVIFLANVLAETNSGRQASSDAKAAALASGLARRLLPIFMQIKQAEITASHKAADTQFFYALLAVIIGALGVLVTARFVHLPMERFIIGAQSEIEASQQRAEAASEAKSVFLATMSHEIRTPLNGVLGLAELLNDTELDDNQRHMIRMMIVSGNSLLSIINDVLDLSKAEAGKLELEAEAFNVRTTCLEVIDLFSARAKTARINLHLTVSANSDCWHVLGYSTAIRQIVVNLISNALKFTQDGSVEVKLMDLPRAPNGPRVIRIAVRDTGIGIPPEAQERIFEQFAQADASTTSKYGGTGLGLAIVKNLATAIGGRVFLTSAEGEGAEFTVDFPVEPVPGPIEVPEAAPLGSSFDKKVLVVDDNRVNQMVASKMLERLGCTVITAGNGFEAIDLAESWAPDVILMDIRMPELDGLGATRAIRLREQEQGLPAVPIIGLSANAMAEHRAEGLSVGMTDYLSKPINKAALAGALTRLWPDQSAPSDKGKPKCA